MNDSARPDPDALLASLKKEEQLEHRGRLKIFFGMCPGVGKTYAMLKAARQRLAEGEDVVVGVVETHGRVETAALLEGMIAAPRKAVDYRGVTLEEMDIEGILFLRPKLVLVDELAHSNAPGSRHPKRYQDVQELLAAGVDVYSTLNVQHIESRADTVRQITGITVRETVPDSILELAAEVELIDITPERLRERLVEGKVYLGERAGVAAENFFKESHLTALRELALRLTAERVDQQLRGSKQEGASRNIWKSGDRLMVAVGPSPFSLQLVRWTRRMAYAMNASWIAVHVESSATLTHSDRAQLDRNLSLARELGAEVIVTHDADSADALVRVARENKVTQIVIGKPRGNPIVELIQGGGVVDRLIRRCGQIDVYVVPAEDKDRVNSKPFRLFRSQSSSKEYLATAAVVAVVTALSLILEPVTGYWAVALIYLFSIVVLSLFLNRGPVFLAATLSALTWNFLFIPPKYTFIIASVADSLMFAMYFVIALATGHLTSRLRSQQRNEQIRELRASALYRLSRSVVAAKDSHELFKSCASEIFDLFQCRCAFFTTEAQLPVTMEVQPGAGYPINDKELSVALWSYRNGRSAGRFTDTLPAAEAYYIPLRLGGKCLGVIGISPTSSTALMLYERDILETFAGQLALVLEREKWQDAAQKQLIASQSEQLQKTLLNSISHELRTPLSVIQASADQLDAALTDGKNKNLASEIQQATARLNRLVQNLLDSARLESGSLRPRLEWGEVGDIISGAMQLLGDGKRGDNVSVDMAQNIPLIHVDFGLLQQALANLIDNALTHTPANTLIRVKAFSDKTHVVLAVEDEGSGLSKEVVQHLFEKFYRAADSHPGGAGLGLSIARGLVEANGGELTAANRFSGGAIFTIRLPIETSPKLEEVS